MVKDQELCKYGLTVVCDNAYDLALHDKPAFVQLRRNGLGASDSSIYLGVNKFTNLDKLIEQKLATELTQEEIEVGEKEAVRKGADLEPIILNKFEEWAGFETYKPRAMYRIDEVPWLTVNFDGIIKLQEQHIPVEAKYVSPYANKYWDRSKCIKAVYEGNPKLCAGIDVTAHVIEEASLYGIPPYYYTQLQQQLLGLNAPFGYLVALFDKGWELGVYKIFADKFTQQGIKNISRTVWQNIEDKRSN